jgi:hypothetical protein
MREGVHERMMKNQGRGQFLAVSDSRYIGPFLRGLGEKLCPKERDDLGPFA